MPAETTSPLKRYDNMTPMTRQTQKEISLVAAVVIYSAALLWWLGVSFGSRPSGIIVSLFVVVALGWVALMALSFALVGSPGAAVLILIPPVLLGAVGKLNGGAIVAALLMAAILATARWRIRDQINDRLYYQTVPIFYGGVRWLTFGFMVAAAGLVVASVTAGLEHSVITIPESSVRLVLNPLEVMMRDITQNDVPLAVAAITEGLNQYLNAIVHNSPLLSALAALITILVISRLALPLLAWPSLILIALVGWIGRQTQFVHLTKQPVISERLQL
jgi:hypothetical protein